MVKKETRQSIDKTLNSQQGLECSIFNLHNKERRQAVARIALQDMPVGRSKEC